MVAAIPPLRSGEDAGAPVGMTAFWSGVTYREENPRGRHKAAPTKCKSQPSGWLLQQKGSAVVELIGWGWWVKLPNLWRTLLR